MIKVGLVGCGRVSKNHIEAIKSLNRSGLVLDSICDVSPLALKASNVGPEVQRYSNLDEILDSARVDLLVITTPSGFHAGHVTRAAGKVSNIVVEKPMALSLVEAQEMVASCTNSGTGLFVVKQNRYNAAVQDVWQKAQDGRFGEIHLGTVRVRWTRNQEYYDQADWRGTRVLDGSVIWNQASHHLDLLSRFMGPVESVFSYGQKALADIEVEDTVVAVARFAGKKIGLIEATTAVRPVDLEGSLSILGSAGSAVIGGYAVNELQSMVFEGQETFISEHKHELAETPPNVYGDGHGKFYSHLVSHIKHGIEFELSGENSLETVRLIEMVDRSVREGREMVR